jgi:hypothetical protein
MYVVLQINRKINPSMFLNLYLQYSIYTSHSLQFVQVQKKRKKELVEQSSDNSMTRVGRDDDSGRSYSRTCSADSPTTSTNKKISKEELRKLYTDRIDSSRELILEDKLKKVEKQLSLRKNHTNKLRIEREGHLQKIEELEGQNDNLLLELASLKLLLSSSSGGGGNSDRVSLTANNNNYRRRSEQKECSGGDNNINNGKIPRSKSAEANNMQKSSVRGGRRASFCVERHDNNKQNGPTKNKRTSLGRSCHDSRHNPEKIATRSRISASRKDYLLGYTAEFNG